MLTDNHKFIPYRVVPPTEQPTTPDVWGPHLWRYLHYCTANYPVKPDKQTVQTMVNWIQTLYITLPCTKCKYHFNKYVEENKYRLYDICSSRENLFYFFVDIHNKVNKRNGKGMISYEDAKRMYNYKE
jgi:hypothetical protein